MFLSIIVEACWIGDEFPASLAKWYSVKRGLVIQNVGVKDREDRWGLWSVDKAVQLDA